MPGGSPAGQDGDPGSPAGAVAAVRDYYAAIAARDYDRAYRHWAGQGRASAQSFEDFRRGFAETAAVAAEVGTPRRVDPAAGSRYVMVPVAVRAMTTHGAAQCFRGSYALRRGVVPGASAEERRWHIASADVEARPAVECAVESDSRGDAEAVAAVVEAFGRRLAAVSLLAPSDMGAQYGPFVTLSLLEHWLQRPAAAPGRTVSSPWPERVEVRDVARAEPDRYRVTANVVYVTSVDPTGGDAPADRLRVEVDVVRDGGWRIAAWDSR